MVRIIVRGKSQSIPKGRSQGSSFFLFRLLVRSASQQKHLYITSLSILVYLKLHNELGYMSWTDVAARCPRKFIVKIDAQLNKEKALLTMAHEMVHIKQYCPWRT